LREQGVGYVGCALRYPGRFGLMFRSGLRKDEPLMQSAHEAYLTLELDVWALLKVTDERPLHDAPPAGAAGDLVDGARLRALAALGALDDVLLPGGRDALLRLTLAPMLQCQLESLRHEISSGLPQTRRRSASPTR
jgi:hypothetical protein